MLRSTLLLILLAAVALPVAAPAATPDDEPLISTEEIAGYGGLTMWVSDDEEVVLREGDETRKLDGLKALRGLDVGPGPDGEPIAVHHKCGVKQCDLYRLDLDTLEERKVPAASDRRADEKWGTVWRGKVAFLRDGVIVTADLERRSTPRPVAPWKDYAIDLELGDGLLAWATETTSEKGTGSTGVRVHSVDGRQRRAHPLSARFDAERGFGFGGLTAERDGLWVARQATSGCALEGRHHFRLGHRTARPRLVASGAPLAARRAYVDVPELPSGEGCAS